MTRAELSDLIRRNTGLRVIAVMLAIGLWLFVNAGQHEAQSLLAVPVSYRRLPPGLIIVNPHPDFVQIQVDGPRTLLSLLDPARLELRLNLVSSAPGQLTYRITPMMFNVPRQTSVTQISPSQIVLDIDRVVSRDVPVHLDVTGPVTSGYTIGSVDLKPQAVTVTGPSRDLSHLERIDTEPFDVKGLFGVVDRRVALVAPSGPVRIQDSEVEARVRFDEIMGDREFRTVGVEVRDPDYKFRLYTKDVNVTVHGPVRKLSSLTLDGMVYVEAKGAPPGVHELPVQVDLPDGFQAVRQIPDKVRLRILGAKVETKS